MSDLKPTLIAPYESQDSPRSFHSSESHPSTPLQSSSDLHTVTLQSAGLPLYNVETYLNRPENHSLLSSPAINSSNKENLQTSGTKSMDEPVQLGSQTSHHVMAFYHLCQERGLIPAFEIEESELGRFGGWLKVGNVTIGSDEKWRSKKMAKEGLAAKGIEVVKGMPAKGKGPASGSSEKNWIGLLLGT